MAGRTGEAAAVVPATLTEAVLSDPVSFAAAARRLDPLATKGEESLGPEPERHREAWTAYDELGEVNQMVSGSASLLSQCRLYIGWVDDSGTEQPIIDPDGTAADGFNPQMVADAQAALARYVDEGGSQRGLLQRQAENFDVTGDSYLVGWKIDAHGKPWDGPEDKAAGERWEVVARGSIAKSNGQWTVQVGQGQAVKLPRETSIVIRMWRKHPRRPDDSRGWVLSSLDVCRDLRVFTLAQRSSARSSIPAPVLVTAQEASPRNLTQPGGPAAGQVPQPGGLAMPPFAGMGGPGPGEPPKAPMTWAAQLERLIGDAVMEVLRDAQSGRAVVPPVLSVAEKYVDKWHTIDLHRPVDAVLKELVDQARERLAESADNPPEMLRGLGETNRWNGAQIADDEFRRYFKPKVMAIADAWTVELVWGALHALGYREEDYKRLRVLVDARGVVAEPDRSKLALEVFRVGGLSYKALRKATGFSEDDAPEPDEQQRIIDAFGRQGQRRTDTGRSTEVDRSVASASVASAIPGRGGELLAALLDDLTPEAAADLLARVVAERRPAIEASAQETPADLTPRTAPLARYRSRTAASIAEPLQGEALASQLTILEATTRTRLEEAAEAAFEQALSRGGAKLKTWARKDHDLRALLAGVDPSDVVATLGPDRACRIAQGQFADEGQRREDMFAAALVGLLSSFGRIVTGAIESALRALGAVVLTGHLNGEDRPGLTPEQIAANVAAGSAVLRASMLQLADRQVFSPAAPATVGEMTSLRVPSPVIRRSMAAAGGEQVAPGLGPLPSAASGLVFGPTLRVFGPDQIGWEWDYTDDPRSQPYRPHLSVTGQVFTGPDDPRLSGIAPDGGQGYPGDHDGCRCTWHPVYPEPEA